MVDVSVDDMLLYSKASICRFFFLCFLFFSGWVSNLGLGLGFRVQGSGFRVRVRDGVGVGVWGNYHKLERICMICFMISEAS